MTQTDLRAKLERWTAFAREKEIPVKYRLPFTNALLQKLGVTATPIFFWPLPLIALFHGVYLGLFWALGMSYFVWRGDRSLQSAILPTLFFAVTAGLLNAFSIASLRRKHNLTTWEQF